MSCYYQYYYNESMKHSQTQLGCIPPTRYAVSRLRLRPCALVARWSACHSVGHQPRVGGIVWEPRELEAIQVFLRIVAPVILVDPALQATIWAHAPH